jgi:hypothetical protein
MAPLDLEPGYGEVDRYIDVAPYRDERHLKLALEGYAATSIGVIIRKGGGQPGLISAVAGPARSTDSGSPAPGRS